VLPTPRISFAKQVDLLRAYAAASGSGSPVGLQAVSDIVNMAVSTISLASPFLQDVGLIEKSERGFLPAQEVVKFSDVYKWDADRAGRELAPVLRHTWFALALLPRINYAALTVAEAVTILATDARATPAYEPQIRLLIDFLVLGGVVVRDGELLRQGSVSNASSRSTESEAPEVLAYTHTARTSSARVSESASPGIPLLIQGLLQQLPSGKHWTRAKAESWLALAKLTFELVYEFDQPVDIDPPERGGEGWSP
jgi:hypothetical protein